MSMNHQRDIYAPLLDKTFEAAVSNFISAEFPRLGGPKVIELFVKELKTIVEHYYPPITNLRMGQLLWFAVAKDEKGGYGKSMKNLRLRPVILTAVAYEDIQKKAECVPQKDSRKSCIARMLYEADRQGGTLAESDLSLILSWSLATIHKDITEYERENNVVLPRRGTVHDLGRSVSHKQIICRKSVQDRKATPDIAWETYHSPNAVDRYLSDFDRVRFCLKKGISVKETAFATQLSKSLVVEYADLIEELQGGERENVN
ncbi:MAG: DUF1670 domain-containing protein [archaeon]|nr:DUF1670 domain-containing protein [archaeon]